MGEQKNKSGRPDWDRLYEIASVQEGHFTTVQAAEAGYSPQLLAKYIKGGRITRIRRGVYRLVHYPAGEHEDLLVIWLWGERAGVFSHQTALMLHGLSDVMPAKACLSLPASWKHRRLRVPKGLVLHFAKLEKDDRAWVGSVPVTSVARSLSDCAEARVAPEFVRDAFEEAADRGLIDRHSLPEVISFLKQFFQVSHGPSGPRFLAVSDRAQKRRQ